MRSVQKRITFAKKRNKKEKKVEFQEKEYDHNKILKKSQEQ